MRFIEKKEGRYNNEMRYLPPTEAILYKNNVRITIVIISLRHREKKEIPG